MLVMKLLLNYLHDLITTDDDPLVSSVSEDKCLTSTASLDSCGSVVELTAFFFLHSVIKQTDTQID